MKVALVHDWLNQKVGGAEEVLFELADMYPDAPIYTLLYNEKKFGGRLDSSRVHASFLQKLPNFLKRNSRYLLPFLPMAMEQFDLSAYDVVISSSTAFAKGVITRPETLHICYCHTPMRFVWDYWPRYIDEQHVGLFRKMSIHSLTSKLRVWDFYSSKRVDHWIANSRTCGDRIQKYYRAEAEVIYPGIDTSHIKPVSRKEDYWVILGSMTPYKKFDLTIAAFNISGRKLKVIGEGSDLPRLKSMAKNNIEFLGRVSNAEKAGVLAGAQALIFAGEDDFGIVPVESMAAGTPVIAFNRGGATETVVDGVTGVLFGAQTAEAINGAVEKAAAIDFKVNDLTSRADEFSVQRFRTGIKTAIDKAYKTYVKTNQI